MNPELIEKITKIVVEKLQSQNSLETAAKKDLPVSEVKFWNHNVSSQKGVTKLAFSPIFKEEEIHNKELIEFEKYDGTHSSDSLISKREIGEAEEKTMSMPNDIGGVENPMDKEELKNLISKTPARIGVGRAGLRPKTDTWLKFRFDHAAAVDAVYGSVDDGILKRLDLFKVNTMVKEKEVYIRRPDYGRKLAEEAKQLISDRCRKAPTVQIIVSDGLSSKAVEENIEDVYLSLKQSLESLALDIGTPFYIEKGRVAVMDDVGEWLKPKVIVLLIGERPGLVSAESLSAYLCFEPGKGTIEADRMVISNIHKGGIPPVEAGAYLGTVIQKILKYEASGVSLVQKES